MTYTPVPERDMDFEWARELMFRRTAAAVLSPLTVSESEGFALDYLMHLYPDAAPVVVDDKPGVTMAFVSNEEAFRLFLLLRVWSRDDTAVSIREDWVNWVNWVAGNLKGAKCRHTR